MLKLSGILIGLEPSVLHGSLGVQGVSWIDNACAILGTAHPILRVIVLLLHLLAGAQFVLVIQVQQRRLAAENGTLCLGLGPEGDLPICSILCIIIIPGW